MADPIAELDQAIADPAAHTADGQSTTARSADDIIKLQQQRAALQAAAAGRTGIQYVKLITPGAGGHGPTPFDQPGGCY